MTTAHRPTFDPARGKEAPKGPAFHQRLLPAHTQLKFRKAGQGGDADAQTRDLQAELLAAEAAHFAKIRGGPAPAASEDDETVASVAAKRKLIADSAEDDESKRRRILEETRDIDADDESEDDDNKDDDEDDDDDDDDDSDSSEEDSDDEDETAELQRELEKIKRERAEKREREEREKEAAEAEERERDIARGNPLLNKADFTIKRRWDDDVVFKNQARGTDDKGKQKEFINDLLRSDFHKRFMNNEWLRGSPPWNQAPGYQFSSPGNRHVTGRIEVASHGLQQTYGMYVLQH
ncbi:complexed with cef1p [Sporothrix bragantina]|uniref:Complexed with cef1p n=1 Tax=Sporothrix bragantina TaxID=671064 RepID=A0ABP0C6P7_9PEZI